MTIYIQSTAFLSTLATDIAIRTFQLPGDSNFVADKVSISGIIGDLTVQRGSHVPLLYWRLDKNGNLGPVVSGVFRVRLQPLSNIGALTCNSFGKAMEQVLLLCYLQKVPSVAFFFSKMTVHHLPPLLTVLNFLLFEPEDCHTLQPNWIRQCILPLRAISSTTIYMHSSITGNTAMHSCPRNLSLEAII